MAAAGRPASPGRTPPFVLVGLLILVCFLAFKYWSLSSENSDLVAELESQQLRSRDITGENRQIKGNLEAVRQELSDSKKNLEVVRAEVTQKNEQIENEKKQCVDKAKELENCGSSLKTCSDSLETEQGEKSKLEGEKEELQNALTLAQQAPKVCDRVMCEGPLKEAVVVAAKLTGSQAIGDALSQAGFDAAKLLEGVNIPPPQAAPPEQPGPPPQNAPAPVQNEAQNKVTSEKEVVQMMTGASNDSKIANSSSTTLTFEAGTERDAAEEESKKEEKETEKNEKKGEGNEAEGNQEVEKSEKEKGEAVREVEKSEDKAQEPEAQPVQPAQPAN